MNDKLYDLSIQSPDIKTYEDHSRGYSEGSVWFNTLEQKWYFLQANEDGNLEWIPHPYRNDRSKTDDFLRDL